MIQSISCKFQSRLGNVILEIFSLFKIAKNNKIPFENIKFCNSYNPTYGIVDPITLKYTGFKDYINACKDVFYTPFLKNHWLNENEWKLLFENAETLPYPYSDLNNEKYNNTAAILFKPCMFTSLNAEDRKLFNSIFNIDQSYFDNLKNKFYKYFNNQPVYAVHVRRTDYSKTAAPTKDEIYNQIQNKLIENPKSKFVMFSDDIIWCKCNFSKYDNIIFHPTNNDNPAEDMLLMSLFTDIISSNYSTYSFISKLLNKNIEQNSTLSLTMPNYNKKQAEPTKIITKGKNIYLKLTVDNMLKNSFVINTNNVQQLETFKNAFSKEFDSIPKIYDGRSMNFNIKNLDNNIKYLSYSIKCTQSHFEIIKMAKALNLPFVTIFEDDAFPINNAKAKLEKWFSNTKIPFDANILMLGNLSYIYDFQKCNYHCIQTDQKTLAKVGSQGLNGSHAYIVFKNCYDKYINLQFTSNNFIAADRMFATNHTKDIEVYSSIPSFFIQQKNGIIQYLNCLCDKNNLGFFVKDFSNIKPITKLISFATLNTGYIMPNAHIRWNKQINQLKDINLLKYGKVYSENDLDQYWKDRFEKYSLDHGYAYWSWKPYIIQQEFKTMDYGDTLCYFDGGCVLPTDVEELKFVGSQIIESFKTIKDRENDVGLTTCLNIPCSCIIRKEILNKFGLISDDYFLFNFLHYQAGVILLIKTKKTEKLINDWFNFYYLNYESCIHFPFTEKTNQLNNFIHNGADQAILQCLLYKDQYKISLVNDLLKCYTKRQRN